MGYFSSKFSSTNRVLPSASSISEDTESRSQTNDSTEERNQIRRIISEITQSAHVRSTLIGEIHLPSMIAESETNDEDITLVWLGEYPKEKNLSNLKIQLREINNYIKIFANESECLSYLEIVDKEQIFTIIYGSAINYDIVSKINDISTVDSIILFDPKTNRKSENLYADLKQNFKKVIYFAKFENMCANIKENIKQLMKQSVAFSLFDEKQRSAMDLTRDEATFLWFQMLFKVLKNQFHSEPARREMIATCRGVYAGNHNELANIDRYHKDPRKSLDAIRWYTEECFLYRLVNKALRTEDIDSLCTFSPFIVDLCNQLALEHEKRIRSDTDPNGSIVNMYRGQQISQIEVDRMKQNKGKLISKNGFFSTSTSENIAMKFATQRRTQSSNIVAVMFKIKAKANLKSVIFADISHLSAMGSKEEEVLFSIGAVFRIDDVFYDNNHHLWIIQMTATDEGYKSVLPFIETTPQNQEEASDNVFFGRLLNDMGRYQQAEMYCRKLLQTMPRNHPDRAGVYHNLGRAQGNKGSLNEAAGSFTQALDIRRSIDINHVDVARTLNSLGVIHGEKGEYGKAMKQFEKALEIQRKANSGHQADKENVITKKNLLLNMAISYSNIGWIHSLCGAYDKACIAYNEALKIRKGLLKVDDHPLFADYYSAMGVIAHARGFYDNARAEHTKGLHMRRRILPPAHPSIANSYQSLGEIEHENGKYEKALEYYVEACHIRTQSLGVHDLSTAAIYKSIGNVHLDNGAYDKALEFYERALSICHRNVSSGHPIIGDCYYLIGNVYERQGDYEKALGYYVNVHQIILAHLPVEHPLATKIYSAIANLQLRQERYREALTLYESVLKIQEERLNGVKYHRDVILTLNNFGVLYRYQKDYGQSKHYFERALEMCKQCFPDNHLALARILHNMGEMYLEQKQFDHAVTNFAKAIAIRQETLPDDDLSVADSYYKLGYVYFATYDYAQAVNFFTKSRGIYELKHYPDHDDMKRVKRSIAISQENLGICHGLI